MINLDTINKNNVPFMIFKMMMMIITKLVMNLLHNIIKEKRKKNRLINQNLLIFFY